MRNIFFIIIFQLTLGACAQSFLWDGTFQPFFNIRNQPSVSVGDLHELNSGKLIVSGNFDFTVTMPVMNYDGLTAMHRNGSRVNNFGGSGIEGTIIPLNDSVFANGTSSGIIQIDTTGNIINLQWALNRVKTVKCYTGIPLFFADGSSIMSNYTNNSGLPCKIINGTDTFPGRHVVKVDPQGNWDSTFNQGDANYQPYQYVQYDSGRIMVSGRTSRFTHYNGVQIDGMCRVFMDGTLDTTFRSPFDGSRQADPTILKVESNGKIIVGVNFYLKNHIDRESLARLNPDGSLDTTFNNYGSPSSLNPQNTGTTSTIEGTPDGGYLVGGYFQNYQGQAKDAIAKIDSNGNVEPQYFSFGGPSIPGSSNNFAVTKILKSKFGGYYVSGSFTQWDGVACQPIVRLYDLVTGVEEAPLGSARGTSSEVSVYPNPSNGIISIESEAVPAAGRLGIERIEVLNLSGASTSLNLFVPQSFNAQPDKFNRNSNTFVTLSSDQRKDGRRVNKRMLNLTNLKPGVYFLKVTLTSGEVITKKLIKL